VLFRSKLQEAQSKYKVLAETEQPFNSTGRYPTSRYSLLEIELLTGRTHQIRVHAAHIGCPISGDPVYGDGAKGDGGPMRLHARSLALTLPDGRIIRAEAPLPPGWPAGPGPESR
jgi:23S rRNA-/tRNA-specific pseudouridylate synthase